VVAKKNEEYDEYAEQMKVSPSNIFRRTKMRSKPRQAKGNVSFMPNAGSPNKTKIVIQNYVKPGDSMTIFFDREPKRTSSLRTASCMNDPSRWHELVRTVQFGACWNQPRLLRQY
jgi:hypothetical protein